MEIFGKLLFAIGEPGYLLGARPDAAIIFLLFFFMALFFCIKIANKKHLFCASEKSRLKNAGDCESGNEKL